MRQFLMAFGLVVLGTSALAEEAALVNVSGDVFMAGSSVQSESGADDLFLVGQTVRAAGDATGSAHLAGRRVDLSGAVGGDLYALGMDVTVTGDVAGDATLSGYDISVGRVGGDLRATGSQVTVGGPVGGYAFLAAEELRIDGVIEGDVHLSARQLEFGPDARIGGQLVLYEEMPGKLEVPAAVIAEDRIERRDIESRDHHMRPFGWAGYIGSFLSAVIVVAALAALIAALVPQQLAAMRRRILDAPFRTLWLGFLTQSAVIGSAVLFAMTLVGVFLSPAALLVAAIGGFAGYVVGVYAFGVGLLLAWGWDEPASIGRRALAAGFGALVAGVIGLIPVLGWIFLLAVSLAGVGAITTWIFRPRFFGALPSE
jgi:cytoskeletal protein CcmA (bactofilin family)